MDVFVTQKKKIYIFGVNNPRLHRAVMNCICAFLP